MRPHEGTRRRPRKRSHPRDRACPTSSTIAVVADRRSRERLGLSATLDAADDRLGVCDERICSDRRERSAPLEVLDLPD